MIYLENCQLSHHTTIRLGGTCKGYFPESEQELISLLNRLEANGTSYRVVGRMSNILPPDGVADTTVVFCDRLNDVLFRSNTITLSAGVRYSRAIYNLSKDKKWLSPVLIGIPGMVGGMVCQNASCYDDEIATTLLWAEVYSPKEHKVFKLNRDEMRFGYRSSILKKSSFVLLSASFSVLERDPQKAIEDAVSKRKLSRPEGPSLGSVFLRHNGVSIGYLLDRLGQKGRRFGGISVSYRHAGILINSQNGTAKDYIHAVESLQEMIKDSYGFIPECEIEILS